jgi:uncharacterized protein (UPF0147 family)
MKKKIMEEFHKLIDKGRELTKKHDDLFNEIIKDDRIPDNLKESLEMFYEKLGFNATHVAVAKEI